MGTINPPNQIFVGRFEMGGKSYKVKLSYPNARDLLEVSLAAAEKAMQSLIQSMQGVNPSEIERISLGGIQMKDGTVKEHEGYGWSDFSRRVTTDLNRQMIPWGQEGHQMHFEDPQHWRTDLSFIRSDPLFQRLEKREPHRTFESLQQLEQQQLQSVEKENYEAASCVDRFMMDKGYKKKANKSTPIGIHLSTKRREDYEYSVQVMDSLIDLSEKEIMIGGYRVRCDPIFFTDQFNAWNRMEKVLPEWLNGREESEEASSIGNKSFREYAADTLRRIPDGIRAKQIRDTLEELDKTTLPEERVLCRAYLCQLLDLPITYHCQSCVDRTSIAVAVTLAADQWLKTKKTPMVDGKFCITELLQKEKFKELFAGHVHPGLIVGEYSRGKKGLRFQKGVIQNEQVLRLLPKRYLRDFSMSDL